MNTYDFVYERNVVFLQVKEGTLLNDVGESMSGFASKVIYECLILVYVGKLLKMISLTLTLAT